MKRGLSVGWLAVLAAAFALAACGDCGGRLVHKDPRCGEPCYGGDAANAGKGVCNLGRWICGATGAPKCDGWGAPVDVVCNGKDNDCDGIIDAPTVACGTACGLGVQRCATGVIQACDAPQPKPEVCNGLDDDCNGIVDDISISFCYDGPFGTAGVGACHPGVVACVNGATICVGEQTPVYESCGVGDVNCDGLVTVSPTTTVDVVFLIDTAGLNADDSMTVFFPAMKLALVRFIKQYDNTNYRFAVVLMPAAAPSTIAVALDFSAANDAATFISTLEPINANLDSEPAYGLDVIDAVAGATNGVALTPPLVALSWRHASARFQVFISSDESEGAYVPGAPWGVAPSVVGADLVRANQTFIGFVQKVYAVDYAPIATTTGGSLHFLTTSSTLLFSQLNASIVVACN